MPIYRQPFRTASDKKWTNEQLAFGSELEALVTANAAALVERPNPADVAAFEAAVEASKFRQDSCGQWFRITGTKKVGEIAQPVTIQVPTPVVLQPVPVGSSIVRL